MKNKRTGVLLFLMLAVFCFGCVKYMRLWQQLVCSQNQKRVGKYSLGMRQRLGIAQAIMEDPDILILDEPMNGLDEEGVQDIRILLLKLKEKGKTIILATHSREDVQLICDRYMRWKKESWYVNIRI